MGDDLRLAVRYVGGVAVVAVGPHGAGEPLPPGGFEALVEQAGGRLVLDLAGDAPLGSAVLGRLLTLHRKFRQAGARFRLCCPPGPTLDVLQITKLDKLIPTFPTLAAALHGL